MFRAQGKPKSSSSNTMCFHATLRDAHRAIGRTQCWSCKAFSANLHCSNLRCAKRCRLTDPQLANFSKAQEGIDVSFAQTAWALSLGLRMSHAHAAHLLRRPNKSFRFAEDRVRGTTACTREPHLRHRHCRDSARFSGKCNGDLRAHAGRTLVLKSRVSKDWTAQPSRYGAGDG